MAIKQEKKLSTVWVKFVGLAIYLWSQKTNKNIGYHSGGWMEGDEGGNTTPVRIKGNGSDTEELVTIENSIYFFTIQTWVELPSNLLPLRTSRY